MCPIPVSYTHLDVYKRQDKHCRNYDKHVLFHGHFTLSSLMTFARTISSFSTVNDWWRPPLAICSDGNQYKNINKTKKVKKLEKQKRRLQRSISRSYENNKQGKEYCKTKNVIKKEKLLLTLNHRLTKMCIRDRCINNNVIQLCLKELYDLLEDR